MKAKLFFFLLIVFLSEIVEAQETIRGTVVDKNGNPVPGTKITNKKSETLAITSLDGTFEITSLEDSSDKLYFNCAGMNQVKKRWNGEDMTVVLRSDNFWNRESDKWHWFFMPQVSSTRYAYAYGGMIGTAKKFGPYIRYNQGGTETIFFTGGCLFRVGNPLYLYFGGGWSGHQDTPDNYHSVAIDGGLIIRLWKIGISGGAIWSPTGGSEHVVPTIGIGVTL